MSSRRMPMAISDRIGPYQITGLIGAGGMGEVYRARDTKLNRDVALKVLPDLFAHDRDRLGRFQREALVLASLNHPNIAQIYGLEESGGSPALVMELVDGPTLADRIAAGPIPLDEALAIARQIAGALEVAHAQGIVHRDLKPANIKIRANNHVKVLDFGLAKALDPATTAASAMTSPTLSIHATQAGIVLGTAAYMAPEQARGKAVDTRADVWAFGAVLFEMLAGRRAFQGDEISDMLASILKSEPEWQTLPSDTPAAIRRLLTRCLQKDVSERLQHIGDARLDIDEAQHRTPSETMTARASWRERALWSAAVVIAAVAAALIALRNAPAPDSSELRLEVSTPGGMLSQFALSPDGRTIAYVAIDAPRGRQIFLRPLASTTPSPVPGTEGAEYPFWSPDGQSIGFFAQNKLKRMSLDGAPAQSLANVLTPAGGTWNQDGTILYVPNDSGGVFRLPAAGGEPSVVTPRQSPPLATRAPQFLPDGRHFLFYVARGGDATGVFLGELGSPSIRRLLSADRPAVYGTGHLWFVRDGSLFAQPFDPATQALSGAPIRVENNIGLGLFAANVSTSVDGPVAYRPGSGVGPRQLIWFDRSGKQLSPAGEEGALVSNPSLSADGRYVAVQRTVEENIDVWLLDLQRDVYTRLTDHAQIDSLPIWAPDGNRIVFNSQAVGRTDSNGSQLAILRVDRTSAQEALPLSSGPGVKIACDWSLDGRFLLYKQFEETTGTTDLWALPLEGDRKPFPVAETAHDERDGQLSPDGKWVAYESDESGNPEVYLQPFPGPGAKVRVSSGGGTQVRWRRDGKELFYLGADDQLTAVSFDMAAGTPSPGKPLPLFKTMIAPIRAISRQQYVVAPDGQRFLIVASETSTVPPLTILLNWRSGIRD